MSVLTRIRTNTVLKRIAQRVEKWLKRCLTALLWQLLDKPEPVDVDRLDDTIKILLIRPNYRIGNALIITPLLQAFRDRFPAAQLDFLLADTTQALFKNQPIDRFFSLSRQSILRPWLFISLLRRLRGEQYDLAVQIGAGSLTGCVFARLIGARYSMGKGRGGQRWFNIEVTGKQQHAYDAPLLFARTLGVSCRNRPSLRLAPGERDHALALLQQHSVQAEVSGDIEPFAAVFVGGHLDKRCSLAFWLGVLRRLDAAGIRYVVFLGPEEKRLGPPLERQLATSDQGALCYPRPLREFAAMLERAHVLITPDSGPMHLAAALDVPTVTIVRKKKTLKFAPRESFDTSLWEPDAEQVLQALNASGARRNRHDPNTRTLPWLATG